MNKGEQQQEFPLRKENYVFIIVGVVITVLGYILMSGGGSADRSVFVYEEIFSPMRISVAPTLCLIGFAIVMFGIMKKPKQ